MVVREKSMANYRPLHTFLAGRFADRLVLTFGQMEDLLGFPLPAEARQHPSWWELPAGGAPRSEQAECWASAQRTATANLQAATVLFERA